jgi:hypothetical protein
MRIEIKIYVIIILKFIFYKTFSLLQIGQTTFLTSQSLMQGEWKECLPGHLRINISSPSTTSFMQIIQVEQ